MGHVVAQAQVAAVAVALVTVPFAVAAVVLAGLAVASWR